MHHRKIIHIDCDCFYASIEMRDDPLLNGRPVAVGGNAAGRGVIATANYEARQYGVHSAMASAYAKKLCPGLIIIRPDFNKYREASRQLHCIFHRYTTEIEPLSLDEAFLDVTGNQQCKGSATLMAGVIRQQVFKEIGITVSAGIAPNKFLAKIASDWNKPNGQYVITPDAVNEFLEQLPVARLSGVGKVTTEKLHQLNIKTCGDLRRLSVFDLTGTFGSFGGQLYKLARGIDTRPVKQREHRKSLSVEQTYDRDLTNIEACLEKLPVLNTRLQERFENLNNTYQVKKVFVKIRFSDFNNTSVETTVKEPSLDSYRNLCRQAYQRGKKPVRLLGIGVRFDEEQWKGKKQLVLDIH